MIRAAVRCAARRFDRMRIALPDRHLAARRGRPRDARARLLALPRRARPRGPRRHDGRRRAGRAAVRGRGRLAAAAVPAALRARGAARRARGPRAPTSSTPPRPTPPPRPQRCSRAGRSSSSSSRTRRTSGRGATGSSRGTLEEFQRAALAPGASCCKAAAHARARAAPHDRRAERVPGARSRPGGGSTAGRMHVLTNPAPPPREVERRAAAAGTFVFVGRLTRQKDLGVAIEAVARVPEARLVVVGDGPERASSSASRRRPARTRGSSSAARGRATTRSRSSPAPTRRCSRAPGRTCRTRRSRRSRSECPSSRRPSAACPRSSATARTACSCRPVAGAARGGDPSRARGGRPARPARRRGAPSVGRISASAIYGRLEALLAGGRALSERPRVLFVGRGRYRLPLPAWLARKWDAVEARARLPVARRRGARQPRRATTASGSRAGRPRRLDGVALLPAAAAARAARDEDSGRTRSSRPIRSSAPPPSPGGRARRRRHAGDRRGARRLAHVRAAVRLAGAPARRVRSATWLAELAVRRADATRARLELHRRASSSRCAASRRRGLHGVQRPLGVHRAAGAPLPERPTALFVGALERYKNVDGLAAAWRRVAARAARGAARDRRQGSRRPRRQLVRELPERVEHHA